MERDRLGRRRQSRAGAGLRPLHPLLPEEWVSKALRVAMSESDWAEFEALAARCARLAPTQARAYGTGTLGLLHAGSISPSRSLARSTGWTGSVARRFACCRRAQTARSTDGLGAPPIDAIAASEVPECSAYLRSTCIGNRGCMPPAKGT